MFNKIHERLAEVYDEFDKYSRITNTEYSIDADYPSIQGYTILKCNDLDGFVRHIANFVKDKWVDMSFNGVGLEHNDLDKQNFHLPRKRQNLIQFTLTPIEENTCAICGKETIGDIIIIDNKFYHKGCKPQTTTEDQYKFPEGKRKRDMNPRGGAALRKQKTAFTYENFDRRLDDAISENVDISFKEPEVLFTKSEDLDHGLDKEELKSHLSSAKIANEEILSKLVAILEHIADDKLANDIENLIENYTSQISNLDRILDGTT